MSIGYDKTDVSIKTIFSVGIISVSILVVIIIASAQYFSTVREEMIDEYILQPVSQKLTMLRDRENHQLATFGIIDKEKGIYRIPIEEAIKKVVAEK